MKYQKMFKQLMFHLSQILIVLAVVLLSLYEAEACDCEYHSGGCSISKAASPGSACRCSYRFWNTPFIEFSFATCSGSEIGCRDPDSQYCKNPDKSVQSCFLGGGDCGGY